LHIPNCATIQKPLSALTGKAKTLVWNEEAENAFLKLKKLLISPQLLAYPDYKSAEPLEMHVDSSLTGAGAVLSQKQLGVIRPIAFISTSWGVSEQDYASTARELAGLRWAVKKLAPFLRGRKFVIHTDNQPLIFLSNTKCISSRLARTLEDLSDFDFDVKWIPGHSNIVADALSRMHESNLDSSRAKETLNVLGESLKEIKMEGGGDSLVHALSYFLTGNILDSAKLRQQLVSELLAHPKLYGLDLSKTGKFELKIMSQEGINLIPEAIKAFSNLYNCKITVFEKRRYPIHFGEDNLPNMCFLNSYNSLHYNLLINNDSTINNEGENINTVNHTLNTNKVNQVVPINNHSPLILPEGRVESEIEIKNKEEKVNIDSQNKVNLNISIAKVCFNKWTKQEILSMQKSNTQLKLLRNFINDFPPGNKRIAKCQCTPMLTLFLSKINDIYIHENILVREVDRDLESHRFLAIVPLNCFIQGAIDTHITRAHCGQHVLQKLLRETVWNPHDWRVTKDVCHTCQLCQRFKPPCNVAHPGFKKIISECPFDLLSIDLVNLPLTQDQFRCCLVAIDHFTKYMYTVPLKNKTSDTIVQALEKVVFQRCLQLPSRIQSDNGPEFDNTLYRQMLVRYNIKPIYTSPNHPESNGGVERANQTLIKLLALYQGDQSNWVQCLPEVVRIYNSNPHSTTQRSPVSFFLERANSLRSNYNSLLSATWREPSHKFAPFSLGQLVGKKIFHSGHLTTAKFAPKFEGPYKIISVNEHERSYEISLMVNELTLAWGKVSRAHHSHLRPWVPRPNYLASFDLGGKAFPPAVQLNKNHSYLNTFGRGAIGNTSANSSNNNNFIGFMPASPPTPQVIGGGQIARTLTNNNEVVPETPQPHLLLNHQPITSTPTVTNCLPENLNISPVLDNNINLENLEIPNESIITPAVNANPNTSMFNDDELEIPGGFEGFPLLDSSDERTLSRLENLLITPPAAVITRDEPIDLSMGENSTLKIPGESSENITVSPERVQASRIPIPIVINSPSPTRIKRSNMKPAGFYSKM
ncbi:unnamed protein product, partial [Rotaria magnacalcarata]